MAGTMWPSSSGAWTGAIYGRHPHRSWEQIFALEGGIDVDGTARGPGDYDFPQLGESYDVTALAQSVVLFSLGKP